MGKLRVKGQRSTVNGEGSRVLDAGCWMLLLILILILILILSLFQFQERVESKSKSMSKNGLREEEDEE
jgi:hypothetical protein